MRFLKIKTSSKSLLPQLSSFTPIPSPPPIPYTYSNLGPYKSQTCPSFS